jgi:uncharacterized membrane protein YgcG
MAAAVGAVAAGLVGCSGRDPGASVETARSAQNANPQTTSFAVYAQNSATLRDRVGIMGGDVGVRLAGTGPFVGGSYELTLASDSHVDTARNVIANRVQLLDRARVGDVQVSQVINHNGFFAHQYPFPPNMPVLPPTAPVTPGTAAVTVNAGSTLVASPGSYGSVSVGDRGILRLKGGVYQLASLTLSNDARVEALAPVQVRVAGRFTAFDRTFIVPAAGVTLASGDLRIEVSGKNGSSGSLTDSPKAAQFGNDSNLRAVMLVPNGTLQIGQRANLVGAYVARDVSVDIDSTVTYQSGVGPSGCLQSCDDGNPCTIDACSVGVCVHTSSPAGTSCADSDACNGAETCDGAGHCKLGTPVACSPLDQCHVAGICNPATGACSNPAKTDGTSCNDGNACTRSDICRAGVCVGADPVVCTALDQCHAAGICDPTTGACSNPAQPDGTGCDDGSACTQADACQSGVCVGANPVVCAVLDQCHVAGSCDPSTGACSNPAKADGSPCNDANACTQVDACLTGVCVGSNPVQCKALDVCHQAGACNPATGQCTNPEISCDDQNPCTTDGCDPSACKPGKCTPADICAHVLTYGPACTLPAPRDDIQIIDATIATASAILPRGESVPVSYTLQAATEHTDDDSHKDNYSIEFILFPTEISTDMTPKEGVSLGGSRLLHVPAGTSDYSIWLTIPTDIPPGDYNLYAHRYPDGDFLQGTVAYTVTADPVLPSFDLSNYRAGSTSLFFDQESTVDPNDPTLYRPIAHSGTLEIVSRNQAANQVPVRAYLYWPNQQSAPLALSIWDYKKKAYGATLLVDGLKADQSKAVLLDLVLPESTAQQLRAAIPPQTAVDVQIAITINDGGELSEAPCASETQGGCRHSLDVPATLFWPPADSTATTALSPTQMRSRVLAATPASASELQYHNSWQKDVGNDYFYAGIHFDADAQLTVDGLSATVQGTVPVIFLSGFPNDTFSADLVKASLSAAAPVGGVATASGSLSFGCTDAGCLDTPFSFSAPGEFHFPYLYPVASVSTEIVIVVVPVTLAVGADVNASFDATISATAASGSAPASLTVTPSVTAGVTGWAHAGVGVVGMSAGVEGTVTLVSATLAAPVSGECAVVQEGNWDVVKGSLHEQMTVSGEMLNGTIGLYAEYPGWRWCKKTVWGVKVTYPCDFGIQSATKDICAWDGITLGPWTLYDKNQDLFRINKQCNPNTCTSGMCGTLDDGCGGTVDCGATCPNQDDYCELSTHQCLPKTCAQKGWTCDDGCGTCDNEHSCVSHTCQCAVTCQSLGWACGGGGTTACTSGLNCGSCLGGQDCINHVCVDNSPGTGGSSGGGGGGGGGSGGGGGTCSPSGDKTGQKCGTGISRWDCTCVGSKWNCICAT